MLLFAGHTDGWEWAPTLVSDDACEVYERVADSLMDVLGLDYPESHAGVLDALWQALDNGESYAYGEPADPYGATVSWGFAVTVLP